MWFSHMWNHQQPHLYDNITQLEMDMTLNREFAKVATYSLFDVGWDVG
jgi:heparan sulfate N-deacetylase/N-sulfotransferase NDST2